MKSTGWIAVAGWLIASPLVAQEFQLPPDVATSAEPLFMNRAVPLNRLEAFEAELEQLGKEIAAIKVIREQVAAESKQSLSPDSAEAQEQRRELLDLLTKLATKKIPPKPAADPIKTVPTPTLPAAVARSDSRPASDHPLISDKIVDPYALGRALFRAEDYVGAEQAFRKAKVTDDNRVLLQYLIATCLRKQARWEQAAKAYRTVAENKEDPALRDLAEWQLENIRWHRKTELQLEELRRLREQTDPAKSPPQASKPAAAPH